MAPSINLTPIPLSGEKNKEGIIGRVKDGKMEEGGYGGGEGKSSLGKGKRAGARRGRIESEDPKRI